MENKKIILITRAYDNLKIKRFIERFYKDDKKVFEKIIVLVDVSHKKEPYYTQAVLSRIENKDILDILEILHVQPYGIASGALNIGLTKAFDTENKPDYILIASPEVELEKKHVDEMSKILSKNEKLLVVGYALKAFGKGHIKTKNGSNALKVPWNTCAMWNAELFYKNVGAFNIICDCSNFLGKDEHKKALHGMEDALAIALAKIKNPSLKIKLLWENNPKWNVDISEKEEQTDKMERKSKVYKKYIKLFEISENIKFD